jgi:hypothetical protein
MKRLDQGHLHPKLEIQDRHVPYVNRSRASAVGGKHSGKEPFEQHVNNCSEHLHTYERATSGECSRQYVKHTVLFAHCERTSFAAICEEKKL